MCAGDGGGGGAHYERHVDAVRVAVCVAMCVAVCVTLCVAVRATRTSSSTTVTQENDRYS